MTITLLHSLLDGGKENDFGFLQHCEDVKLTLQVMGNGACLDRHCMFNRLECSDLVCSILCYCVISVSSA